MKPQSKLIVITGVSRGCGRALAAEFIRRGHVIAGCARSESALAPLRTQYPAPHHFTALDVADHTQVAAWAQTILTQLGVPDLLINNVALVNRSAPLWEVPAAEFSAVIDVNLKGTANVIREFAPAMIQRRHGVIVNFRSGWGRSTDANVAPYCATKWAIEGLTQALAQELPAGMAAVPLNPGIIHTDMLQSCFGPSAASYPTPETWAQTAAPFLLKLNAADNGTPLTVPGK